MSYSKSGFTIVELLVVIVVIGILATISVVGYTGISQRAIDVVLAHDVKSAVTKIDLHDIENGQLPSDLDEIDEGQGLRASQGNLFSYTYDSVSEEYCVQVVHSSGRSYFATSDDKQPREGECSGSTSLAVSDPANWLQVGTQVWAKYNLNVGTRINGTSSQTNNGVIEKYCYNNIESNCTTYGALYQWDEAMQYSTTAGSQGICPAGSHIPTDVEWKTLEMQLGMTQVAADATTWRGTDQGTKLKPGGTSGLSLPLAGYSSTAGSFSVLSSGTILWSSSESSLSAWNRGLGSGYATVSRNTDGKGYGFSVRCLGN
jgi:uncharacterized protein (TIGR02145 family)/prepilin-type N-terminal cleavage/methylation domain-containing protein